MREEDIPALLDDVRSGDIEARNRLVELMYPELKRAARGLMAKERTTHTLGATGTGLINELWMRLLAARDGTTTEPRVDLSRVTDMQHMLSIATNNMRQILVDYARQRRAKKRPNPKDRVDTEQLRALGEEMASIDPDALDVDTALARLRPKNPQAVKALELKYFLGFTNEEGAAAMGLPLTTYRRKCDFAMKWLRRELTGEGSDAAAAGE